MEHKDIVSDADVKKHHWGNFGNTNPREIINQVVISAAFGYCSGSTATDIALCHKLIKKPRAGFSGAPMLTKKGQRYLRSIVDVFAVYKLAETTQTERTE